MYLVNQPAINHSVSCLVSGQESQLVSRSASHKLFSQLGSHRTVESVIQSISQRYICKSFSVLVSLWTVESVTKYYSESMYYLVSPQSISYSISHKSISQMVSYWTVESVSQLISHKSFSQLVNPHTVESVIQSINQPIKSLNYLVSPRTVE